MWGAFPELEKKVTDVPMVQPCLEPLTAGLKNRIPDKFVCLLLTKIM